jgi:hypothetical protein
VTRERDGWLFARKQESDWMSVYVLKKWHASSEPNEDENYVDVSGRSPGLISWVLSLIGIEPTVRLTASTHGVSFEQGSLAGTHKRLIPLRSISSVYHGFTRPWRETLALLFMGNTVVTGIVAAMAENSDGIAGKAFLAYAIVFGLVFVYFALNKQMALGIVENGSVVSGIRFKRSVIEGKALTGDDAANVSSILEVLPANLDE